MADQHRSDGLPHTAPEPVSSLDPTGAVDAHEPKQWAAGLPAVANSFRHGIEQMGLPRTARVFGRLNQDHGFDCPSCAWPDPEAGHRHAAEFCESGAKAVAWEATKRRVDREFFAKHSVAHLDEQSEWWLGQQGRLTEPMHLRPGGSHYEPVSWDEANAIMARHLRALPTPDDAVFYTSGRTSNEAAFLYQLMVRAYGTNNLPDCSNMCHESSGTAMSEQIGIGKGAVTLESLEQAELIVIAGQNPGTNAPRMLTHLERAKENGAVIVAVNPLPEAGLIRFKNPQTPRGLVGPGTALADDHLQIRLGGDHALFRAVGHLLVAAELAAPARSSTAPSSRPTRRATTPTSMRCARSTGPQRSSQPDLNARRSRRWRTVHRLEGHRGLLGDGPDPARARRHDDPGDRQRAAPPGQHRQGRRRPLPGARPLQRPGRPHDGHLGADAADLPRRPRGGVRLHPADRARRRRHGHGPTVARQVGAGVLRHGRQLRDGHARHPSGPRGAARCDLTVHVSTKLNRSHTVTGTEALILPCLGRTDRDSTSRGDQGVTVEDSQGQVHLSRGRLDPPSEHCRSEVAIVAGLAHRIVPGVGTVDWRALGEDNDLVREHISHVVPNFADYNARVREPGGFLLPHKPRDLREFDTPSGKAEFLAGSVPMLEVPEGRLLLQTIRSHDQFNTTIYGHADRYRGISGNRRVVLVNPDDLHRLGFHAGQVVDVVSEFEGVERRAEGFTLVAYPTAAECAAAYYPETNVLMSADHVALRSNTPVAKALVVRFEAR